MPTVTPTMPGEFPFSVWFSRVLGLSHPKLPLCCEIMIVCRVLFSLLEQQIILSHSASVTSSCRNHQLLSQIACLNLSLRLRVNLVTTEQFRISQPYSSLPVSPLGCWTPYEAQQTTYSRSVSLLPEQRVPSSKPGIAAVTLLAEQFKSSTEKTTSIRLDQNL